MRIRLTALMLMVVGSICNAQDSDRQTKIMAAWHRDFTSPATYEASVEPNRDRLRQKIGAVDERAAIGKLEIVGPAGNSAPLAETEAFTVHAVRWPVLNGVFGEGLWLRPKGEVRAAVVAIPDADQSPEMIVGLLPGLDVQRQFARRLAENGCEVLVPTLIARKHSSKESDPPNGSSPRESICRQAFAVGRHIVGYEVQKVLAAVDFLTKEQRNMGVAGYGEGGLLAFHAAALDSRIGAALVSGWFDSRERMWQEPLYRQVFGLLREFGDAEIATLIAPRVLVIEHSEAPELEDGKSGTPDYSSVEMEFERARELLKPGNPRQFDRAVLITGAEGMTTGPGSDRALEALLEGLGLNVDEIARPGKPLESQSEAVHAVARQQRQIHELEAFTRRLFHQPRVSVHAHSSHRSQAR